MPLCIAFPPIATKDARILILGSLPGEASLRRGEYYGKKENAFWKIMGTLVGASPELPYAERTQRLKEKNIALWDVCARAKRKGSLDSNIEPSSIVANDFRSFFKTHKKIELVCFNGQPAERLFRRYVRPSLSPAVAALPHVILPSTSPAYARMSLQEKLARWREIIAASIRAG